MTSTTTRRALLKAAPVAAAAFAIPASAASFSNDHDEGLSELIAHTKAADAECEKWHDEIYNPALDAYRSAVDAIPHITTTGSYISQGAERRTLTTARNIDVAVAASTFAVRHSDSEFGLCCRELREAVDERKRRIAALQLEHRLDHLTEKSTALANVGGDAICELEAFPVRTFDGMAMKYRALREIGAIEDEQFLQDIERIMADRSAMTGREA